MKLFEKRLLELRQLVKMQREWQAEGLKKQPPLTPPDEEKEAALSELVLQCVALERHVSELKQQNKRLRERIRSVALLQGVLPNKKG